MRVAILKEKLVSPRLNLNEPQKYAFTPITNTGWGLITSRVPLLCPNLYGPNQLSNPLDGGFFFPLPNQEGGYGIPYKKLVIGAKSIKKSVSSSSNQRINTYWEILEGGQVDLSGRLEGASDAFTGEDYTSSILPPFYTGARPRPREYSPAGVKGPFMAFEKAQGALQGALRGKLGPERVQGEAHGYAGDLRLLPKKKRTIRGKSVGRACLRRPSRYSGLKIPVSWSRNTAERPQLAPKLPLLNSQPLAPLRAYGLSREVLEFNTAGLQDLAKRREAQTGPRGGVLRIVQTRYKPGLSKWWRLLRLHYCLCWGIPWLRQRRFTNYISQLAHITGLSFIRMCTSSIGFVVRASFLVFPQTLLGEKAFINGIYAANPFFQVYKGDRVALLTPSVPSKHRRQAFTAFLKAPPFKTWEVDGLTRSVSIWSDPSIKELQGFAFTRPVPFLTFRMYNWKYRH